MSNNKYKKQYKEIVKYLENIDFKEIHFENVSSENLHLPMDVEISKDLNLIRFIPIKNYDDNRTENTNDIFSCKFNYKDINYKILFSYYNDNVYDDIPYTDLTMYIVNDSNKIIRDIDEKLIDIIQNNIFRIKESSISNVFILGKRKINDTNCYACVFYPVRIDVLDKNSQIYYNRDEKSKISNLSKIFIQNYSNI